MTLTGRLCIVQAESRDTPDTPVLELFEALDRYRIVWTEGRFVGATGFTKLKTGRVAVPSEISRESIDAKRRESRAGAGMAVRTVRIVDCGLWIELQVVD